MNQRGVDGCARVPVATNVHLPVRVGTPHHMRRAEVLSTVLWHRVQVDTTSLRLVFANWVNEGGRARPGLNPIRVSVRLDIAGSALQPRFAAAPEVIIEPGRITCSDPIPVTLWQGAAFRTTTTVTPLGGQWVPLGAETDETEQEGVATVDAASQRVPPGTDYGYGPWQILGTLRSAGMPTPPVVVSGDSNAVGFGDQRGSASHLGWVRRLFDDHVPTVNLSLSGATAVSVGTAASRAYREQLLGPLRPRLAIVALGTNDLQQGGDLTPVQDALSAHWREFARRGMRVVACTVPPVTTSVDGWTTLTGQAPTPGFDMREQLNDWIRNAPAPVEDVLDLSRVVAPASDPYRWIPGHTSDGVHLNARGHAAVAGRFARFRHP